MTQLNHSRKFKATVTKKLKVLAKPDDYYKASDGKQTQHNLYSGGRRTATAGEKVGVDRQTAFILRKMQF